ncbi:MAG: LysR family transcriptional regulator [Faecalibacterium sp.]|jgi:DNA-binding transcriptional LysR family regulator|nr:LysR family transcriptional regulator [Faecalibacterium sp.]
MELRTLEYFLAVAEEENITRAAERLHLSQPPLTRQMHQLEQELGVALFVRGKRRTTLTREGVFLKRQAEQMLSLAEKTRRQMGQLQGELSGRLYVGGIETAAQAILGPCIAAFQKEHPKVSFSWSSANSDEIAERLDKGLVDVAVLRSPIDEARFCGIPLFTEGWAAFMPQGGALDQATGKNVTVAQLSGFPLIIPGRRGRGREIEGWFAAEGWTPEICCDVNPQFNALVLVEHGMGIAILPASSQASLYGRRIVAKPILQPGAETSVLIALPRRGPLSPLVEAFVEYVKNFVAATKEK